MSEECMTFSEANMPYNPVSDSFIGMPYETPRMNPAIGATSPMLNTTGADGLCCRSHDCRIKNAAYSTLEISMTMFPTASTSNVKESSTLMFATTNPIIDTATPIISAKNTISFTMTRYRTIHKKCNTDVVKKCGDSAICDVITSSTNAPAKKQLISVVMANPFREKLNSRDGDTPTPNMTQPTRYTAERMARRTQIQFCTAK
mmetsp:Transcript_51042/g.58666  ORF Transcript_51042/g.58666 Transcript_51042/m.58666 type:complete len:203 (+) Transcript_51042:168-776(+)